MFKTTIKILMGTGILFAVTAISEPNMAEAGQLNFRVNTNVVKGLQQPTRKKGRRKPNFNLRKSNKNGVKALKKLNRNKVRKPNFNSAKSKKNWAKALQKLNRNKVRKPNFNSAKSKKNWAKALQKRKTNWVKRLPKNRAANPNPTLTDVLRRVVKDGKVKRIPLGGINRQTHSGPSRAAEDIAKKWGHAVNHLRDKQNNDKKRDGGKIVGNIFSGVMNGLKNDPEKLKLACAKNPNSCKGLDWDAVNPQTGGKDGSESQNGTKGLSDLAPGRFDLMPDRRELLEYLVPAGTGSTESQDSNNDNRSGNRVTDHGSAIVDTIAEGIVGAIAQGASTRGYADTGYIPPRKTYAPRRNRNSGKQNTAVRNAIIQRHTAPACSRPAEGVFENGLREIKWNDQGGWHEIEQKADMTTKEKTVSFVSVFAANCEIQGYDLVETTVKTGQDVTKTSHYDVEGTFLGYDVAVNDGKQIMTTSFLPDGSVKGVKVEQASVKVSSVTK